MKRIELIDALRGFALFLILIYHAYDGFGTGPGAGDGTFSSARLDPAVTSFIYLLVINKAFAIFSIMFGFSFFIQMDRSSLKGENFSLIFARRLLILFVIGYLHALIYRGDILTKYAVTGFVLLLLSRLNSRMLAALAILLLIQVPQIWAIFQSTSLPADAVTAAGSMSMTGDNGPWPEILAAYRSGSFADVIRVNAWSAFSEVWRLNIQSGRILLIVAYFILGLLLGRSRFFENIEANRKYIKYVLAGGAVLYGALRFIRSLTSASAGYSPYTRELIASLLNEYMDVSLAVMILAAFVMIYHNPMARKVMNLLVPYGRAGLTSYVAQGVIGVIVFYGFGLALHRYSSPLFSVAAGFLILAVQLVFSHYWMKRYAYGPVEWAWRSLTYPGRKIPLKRQ